MENRLGRTVCHMPMQQRVRIRRLIGPNFVGSHVVRVVNEIPDTRCSQKGIGAKAATLTPSFIFHPLPSTTLNPRCTAT